MLYKYNDFIYYIIDFTSLLFYPLHTKYTMSDYLSTYKAELVDRYLQNQISNSEKDTLHALLLQHNRTTVTERDICTNIIISR